MSDTEIRPQKITKPIQLLAAWLVGLILVNGSFLSGAATIKTPEWIPGVLVIAAVINVPIFLISIFLLQTKFRPEMQEDTYYSQYLDKKYSRTTVLPRLKNIDEYFSNLSEEIIHKVDGVSKKQADEVSSILKDSEIELLSTRFEDSRSLSELYLYPSLWTELVDSWQNSPDFIEDLNSIVNVGLAEKSNDTLYSAHLTPTGREVACKLEKMNKLWNQSHERYLKK